MVCRDYNAFNLIDSMDGLVVGIAGIAFAFFMGMAVGFSTSLLAQFSAALFGICIGLFVLICLLLGFSW